MEIKKMDPAVKKKFIQALRSGKFKKATGGLRDVDDKGNICHCAMGVLVELYADTKNVSSKYRNFMMERGTPH